MRPVMPRPSLKNTSLERWSLARRLYIFLVGPLILVSVLVSVVAHQSLKTNALEHTQALQAQADANRVLELLLAQDHATIAMLINPSMLEEFAEKKIKAYDEHKTLLEKISLHAMTRDLKAIADKLGSIDELKLRPIATLILEKLFENPDEARAMYFAQYEPNRRQYESLIRTLASKTDQYAALSNQELQKKNRTSQLVITLALAIGILVVIGSIHILSKQVMRAGGGIDTSSSHGRMIFGIFAALAEFERQLIRERTLAGLQAARARGREGGRPSKLDSDALAIIQTAMQSRTASVSAICRQFSHAYV